MYLNERNCADYGYNLMNSEAIVTRNMGFVPGGSWLTPTTISPARCVRLNATVDC